MVSRLFFAVPIVAALFAWGAQRVPVALAADDALGEKAAGAAADEGQSEVRRLYDLRYKFTTGEVMRTEVTHLATIKMTVQGVSQTEENQSTSIKVWEVGEVADGKVNFVHSVESVDVWQKAQSRPEVRYNSRKDADPPPGYEDFAQAIGVPLTVVSMDDRGRILKRYEKRAQPTSMSTQMTMPLPAEPVTVGTTWSMPMDIDVVLKDNSTKKIATRQQFTLEKVSEEVATIKVDTQILTPVSDPAIQAQLIQRVSKGSVRFDIAAGRVLSQQLDLDENVVGFSGPASSLHYVTRFTERLLPAGEPTARRPPATKAR